MEVILVVQKIDGDAYLSLENVVKSYGKIAVLSGVNMRIDKGEFVCILGNTGCGKSTLLKIMGGIEREERGEVIFQGIPMPRKNTAARQRRFGMVFQQDSLMEWRTVDENVRFPLEVFGLRDSRYLRRVDETLESVGLAKFRGLYPRELSGGMRQRVAIARALVHDPEVLFLDQPFDAVDAITRMTLSRELLKMWQSTLKTIVMITNSIEEALMLGGRIIILSDIPSSISSVFEVSIPFEERMGDLRKNRTFQLLRSEIRSTLDRQDQGGLDS
ncbi:MAG: ABC transporter ATP-binding protein [Synergistaceae bacterium]|jgi:NitT/TauT family transport system ATP-binding protein|nr:ABC transporter ATP-binding protein [Synergistaceae bacterium]